MNEASIQNLIRLEASKSGVTLFRNNVGCAKTETGRLLRYGLANDSKAVNDVFKSSDLIGIRPITITGDHVGQRIGQFVAIEVKHPDWVYSGKAREQAQLNFINLIINMGGFAQFSSRGVEWTRKD